MPGRVRSLLCLLAALLCAAAAPAAPLKRVALVFDDGPVPAHAEPLLALLAREKVAVTFSLVGRNTAENPATARAIAAAGHEVANHSATHAHPKDLGAEAIDREVADGQRQLTATLGTAPRWYWPPYLAVDDRVVAAVQRAGLTLYTPRHLVVSKDYDRTVDAAEIYRLATTDVRDGSVILFHEWRAETRAQLPAILAELRRQGCEFFTFSGLEAALGPRAGAPAAAPVAATSAGAAATGVPAGGESLHAGVAAFRATAGQGAENAFQAELVSATGPGFTQALRVTTARDLSPAWIVETRWPLGRAVKRGDVALVRFHARALASADETGGGQMRVVVQQAGPDYRKSLESTVSMRAEWQEFLLPFTFADDYGPGAAEVALGFGFKRETVEIGGLEVLSFGRDVELAALPRTKFTYPGREAGAPWRAAALARIEQLRKSDFLIEVKDAAGAPVPGYKVRVEQKRSAFQFGTALQFARLVSETPEDETYRRKALELFNAASPENDLKWAAWNGEWKGRFSREQSLAALRWLQAQGLPVRGHVLVWPGWKNLPPSIVALRDTRRQKEIPDLVLKHIADITGATRGLLSEWDVLNEPFDNRDLMGLFGNDIMVAWFKAAAAGAPGVPLYLNDYANHDLVADKPHCLEFFRVAKFLRDRGAPLGGLGLQGHFGAQPNAPENILATLDVYAELKLPIRFTEFDVETEDEQLQADFTRDFLILAYSHPSVVGVQHWGFWEKAHWRPRGALFRADWSEKPAAKAYRALVLNQWRTRLQGTAGKKGQVAGRGFHGDYVVTVEKDGRTAEARFTLRPEEARTVVTLSLP
jgi:GH35 family endo-1,4-beta-xylanase/peptidoglycan/xylan/chitin deacetylase (PgdA/CDA1 family)